MSYEIGEIEKKVEIPPKTEQRRGAVTKALSVMKVGDSRLITGQTTTTAISTTVKRNMERVLKGWEFHIQKTALKNEWRIWRMK